MIFFFITFVSFIIPLTIFHCAYDIILSFFADCSSFYSFFFLFFFDILLSLAFYFCDSLYFSLFYDIYLFVYSFITISLYFCCSIWLFLFLFWFCFFYIPKLWLKSDNTECFHSNSKATISLFLSLNKQARRGIKIPPFQSFYNGKKLMGCWYCIEFYLNKKM